LGASAAGLKGFGSSLARTDDGGLVAAKHSPHTAKAQKQGAPRSGGMIGGLTYPIRESFLRGDPQASVVIGNANGIEFERSVSE